MTAYLGIPDEDKSDRIALRTLGVTNLASE